MECYLPLVKVFNVILCNIPDTWVGWVRYISSGTSVTNRVVAFITETGEQPPKYRMGVKGSYESRRGSLQRDNIVGKKGVLRAAGYVALLSHYHQKGDRPIGLLRHLPRPHRSPDPEKGFLSHIAQTVLLIGHGSRCSVQSLCGVQSPKPHTEFA